MKKSLILLMFAASPFLAAKSEPAKAPQAKEASFSGHDMKRAKEIAVAFEKLKNEFEKWGVNNVWNQIQSENSNEFGSQSISTARSLFADAKQPLFAVSDNKFVSTKVEKNGQSVDGDAQVKAIMDALAVSQDGQVVVAYSRMGKNPADKDGAAVEVKYKAVAWDQRGFGLKDNHKFFVFAEVNAE